MGIKGKQKIRLKDEQQDTVTVIEVEIATHQARSDDAVRGLENNQTELQRLKADIERMSAMHASLVAESLRQHATELATNSGGNAQLAAERI